MRGLLPFLVAATLSLAVPNPSSGGAIYFLNNKNGSANNLVAMPIMPNGSLGQATLTPTNGTGGTAITTLSTPAGIFFSQGSVTTGSNYIFSVNSGSNTISMFAISSQYPTQPQLIDTVSTGGYFPMSVAYSEYLQKVCALNAAGSGGVACFDVSPAGLVMDGTLRALDSKFNESSPRPVGPSNSITQVMFNPASTELLVIIKGDPTTKPVTPGVFLSYAINGTQIAQQATEMQIDDLILNFGASYMSEERFLISAPTFGGAIIERTSNGSLVQTSKIPVQGQRAICWAAYDEDLNYGYLYDAGRTTVAVVDGSTGNLTNPIIAQIPNNNGSQGGLFDTTIVNSVSYSLCDPDCVVALDLRTGNTIGTYNLSSIGTRTEFEGMASMPMPTYY